MKNRVGKMVMTLLLVVCMAVSMFAVNAFATDADSTSKIDNCETEVVPYTATEAADYIAGKKDSEYPTLDGYLFAGWYTTNDIPTTKEEALQCVIKSSIPTDKTEVYALFVKDHVLSVKAQVSSHLIDNEVNDSDKFASIRFVTTIDSLVYQETGIEVSYTYKGVEYSAKSVGDTVYESLFYVDSNEKVWEKTPYGSFCGLSNYFRACTITDVPSDAYDIEFIAKPYWITMCGEKVYGETAVKTVSEGCLRTESYVAASGSDVPYYGSDTNPYQTLDYAVQHTSGSGNVHVTNADNTTETWTVIRSMEDFPSERVANSRYILANDIDCGGVTLQRAIKLGQGSIFEGNGCKILNFSTKDVDGEGIYGAFQLQGTAQIMVRNLQLGTAEAPIEMDNAIVARDDDTDYESYWKDVDVHAKFTKETFVNNNSRATGVFFSTAQGAHTFEDCDVYVYSCASTNENARIGGFVGDTKETTVSLTFINCTTNGDISCKAKAVGGMVGYINPSATTTVTMTNCKANMTITNSGEFAGGLIGWANGDSTNGYPTITLTGCEKTVTVSGTAADSKDAFIGRNNASSTTSITPGATIPSNVSTIDYDMNGDGTTETWTVIRSTSDFPSTPVENGLYILANNIDCGGVTLNQVIQLGAGSVFEGNNCKILNFNTMYDAENKCTGAFVLDATTQITVRNLQLGTIEAPIELENAIVEGDDASTDISYWKNVKVYAKFTRTIYTTSSTDSNVKKATRAIGAFFARANGTHTFENCNVYVESCASITEGDMRIGGFIGSAEPKTKLTFNNCTTEGIIKCSGATLGGIIGYVDNNNSTTITMTDCIANMVVESLNAANKVAGAFIGWANGTNLTVTITGYSIGENVTTTCIGKHNSGSNITITE